MGKTCYGYCCTRRSNELSSPSPPAKTIGGGGRISREICRFFAFGPPHEVARETCCPAKQCLARLGASNRDAALFRSRSQLGPNRHEVGRHWQVESPGPQSPSDPKPPGGYP